MKGLHVEVYSGPYTNYVDADELTLVGDGVDEVFTADNYKPAVRIEPNRAGAHFGPVAYLVEGSESSAAFLAPGNSGRTRAMFGGSFVWTSDSRFRALYPAPVPLHNRYEVKDA